MATSKHNNQSTTPFLLKTKVADTMYLPLASYFKAKQKQKHKMQNIKRQNNLGPKKGKLETETPWTTIPTLTCSKSNKQLALDVLQYIKLLWEVPHTLFK